MFSRRTGQVLQGTELSLRMFLSSFRRFHRSVEMFLGCSGVLVVFYKSLEECSGCSFRELKG